MVELVVGADIGGTSTRVAVAERDGTVVSMATGGAGNPISVGLAASAAEIRSVTARALAPTTGRVASVVIGLAGGSRAAAEPGFLRAAVPDAVDAPAQLVGDLTVAFSSATPAHRGFVIVAGTGAVAGEVHGADVVQQRDGWGWLLGDEGSGFWLGRAAVRATLDALQRERPLGPLQQAVLEASGATGYLDLLTNCYTAPPGWLARFSTLVSRHAASDPVAAQIAEEAVDSLERLLLSLELREADPIVLAGSVLTKSGPVSSGFRARLATRVPNPVLSSTSGVVGALWIGLAPRVGGASAVHRQLVSTVSSWVADSG